MNENLVFYAPNIIIPFFFFCSKYFNYSYFRLQVTYRKFPLGLKSIVLPSHSGIVKIYKIDIDNKFVTFAVL